MTIAESLSTGLETTIIGLATVFAVLIILMIIIQIMKAIFYKGPSKQENSVAQTAPVVEKEEIAVAEVVADDDELIAVLTAAVAASLNTSTYNLQIKSYRRVNNTAPVWNRAGLREAINNRF